MRRTIAAALSGIALLVGASLAAILWLTESPPSAGAHGSPPAHDGAVPSSASRTSPPTAPPPAPSADVPSEPPVEAAAALVASAPPVPATELDLRDAAPDLTAVVTRRCGRMRVETLQPRGDPAASTGALLVLALETLSGEVRVVDSSVQAPGRMRTALVACAQWALRGLVVAAPGAEPGRRVKVPVTVGLDAGP